MCNICISQTKNLFGEYTERVLKINPLTQLPLNRPSDRVRLKNENYAKFSGEIVRLERPVVR